MFPLRWRCGLHYNVIFRAMKNSFFQFFFLFFSSPWLFPCLCLFVHIVVFFRIFLSINDDLFFAKHLIFPKKWRFYMFQNLPIFWHIDSPARFCAKQKGEVMKWTSMLDDGRELELVTKESGAEGGDPEGKWWWREWWRREVGTMPSCEEGKRSEERRWREVVAAREGND